MRFARPGVLLLIVGGAACIDHPDAPTIPGAPPDRLGNGSTEGNGSPEATPAAPAPEEPTAVLTEAVYVLIKDYDGGDWMCTGALVSKNIVITAGHCVDDGRFASWEIVAPLAANKPRVSASGPMYFTSDYADISNPDIGFVRLDTPIELAAYAQPTDVSARVDGGEPIQGITIVRTAEEPEATFKSVAGLTLTSTMSRGYSHGFGTTLFSHGGDSGAGLFLVESGQPSHKLVAVAREPEPDTSIDHFTRIDTTVLAWLRENGAL